MRRAEAYFGGLPQHSMRLGLSRIEAACAALGTPQARFPSVLVGGTNGKGSTCAFLHAALARRHRTVGLYTSPHLVSFRERIRIGSRPISEEELDAAVERLQAAYPAAAEPGSVDALTYFEAATAIALDVFARAPVDVAVLEVGLGGRLDATNVPGSDLAAVAITRLGLDHVEVLGPDLAHIAAEKAGIARPGVPLVSAPLVPVARRVVEARAAEVGVRLVEAGRDVSLVPGEGGLEYRGVRWKLDGLRLGLKGGHQAENAAVALAVLEAAQARLGAGPEDAREGLAGARWPGRLEEVPGSPRVVLDGAHNPDGARALADSFVHLWPGVRPALVFGVLAEKERAEMLRSVLPLSSSVHLCAPPSPRAVPAAQLAGEVRALRRDARGHASVEEALAAARAGAGPAGTVLVCGSLYLVGAVRRLLLGDDPAV